MKDALVEFVKGFYKTIYFILVILLIFITVLLTIFIAPFAFMIMLLVDIPIFEPIKWECEVLKSIINKN